MPSPSQRPGSDPSECSGGLGRRSPRFSSQGSSLLSPKITIGCLLISLSSLWSLVGPWLTSQGSKYYLWPPLSTLRSPSTSFRSLFKCPFHQVRSPALITTAPHSGMRVGRPFPCCLSPPPDWSSKRTGTVSLITVSQGLLQSRPSC